VWLNVYFEITFDINIVKFHFYNVGFVSARF